MQYWMILGWLCCQTLGFSQASPSEIMKGVWKCIDYDITVKAYTFNDKVYGNLLTFPCSHKVKLPLADHYDIHNPKKELKHRCLLNLQVLSNLEYEGKDKWSNGEVYIPLTGQSYNVYMKVLSPTKIILHTYVLTEILGKSLTFEKVE